MDTDPLLCALCIWELAAEASVMSVDGGEEQPAPGPERLGYWLDWALRTGAPLVINRNPLATLHAVTLVNGTATCAGHIHPLVTKHPRAFG